MKKAIALVVVIALGGIAWYGLSPLLDIKKVEDAIPVAAEQAGGTTNEETAPESIFMTSISNPVTLTDTPLHPATGQVRVIETGNQKVLRYENYKTINGPDVRVYLATDQKATEFIDLGPIKGTEGNINYDIPEGTDLDKYHWALTWCEDFNVLFNSADLNNRK